MWWLSDLQHIYSRQRINTMHDANQYNEMQILHYVKVHDKSQSTRDFLIWLDSGFYGSYDVLSVVSFWIQEAARFDCLRW